MSKTASQKLLRDLNQRIGQLEHEKSLMAEYNGRLEYQLAVLREAVQEFFRKELGGAVEAFAAKDRLRRMVQEGE